MATEIRVEDLLALLAQTARERDEARSDVETLVIALARSTGISKHDVYTRTGATDHRPIYDNTNYWFPPEVRIDHSGARGPTPDHAPPKAIA